MSYTAGEYALALEFKRSHNARQQRYLERSNQQLKAKIETLELQARLKALKSQRANLENGKESIDASGGKDRDMYKVPLETPDGKIVWATGATLKELCIRYNERATELESSTTCKVKAPTFQEYAKTYFERVEPITKANTYKTLVYNVKRFCKYIAERSIVDITKQDCQQAVTKMGEKYSHDTIEKTMAEVRRVFAEAVEDGLRDKNPMPERAIKNPVKESLNQSGYSVEEYRKLVYEVLPKLPEDEYMLAYLMAVSLATAARTEEIGAFTAKDFNLDVTAPTVSITKSVEWTGNRGKLQEFTKTEAGRRVLPLQKWAIPYIQKAIEKHKDGYLLRGKKCNWDGKNVPSWSVVKTLYNRSKTYTTGVIDGGFECYEARHAVATVMGLSGVTPLARATFLGHSDPGYADKQYAKRELKHAIVANDALSNFFEKQLEQVKPL